MSQTKGIEEDQDPPRQLNRSTTSPSRASTLSQTIQIITNKFKLSTASPKLRRLRRKAPYDRMNNNQQELSQDGEYSQEIVPPLDDSVETEVFFKTATTTSTVYQVNHNLDDTIPYFDPLLELRRDTYTPLHPSTGNPPSPLTTGDVRRTYTPPLLPVTNIQLQAIPGTSSDTTHAEINPIDNIVTANTSITPEENQEAARDIREQKKTTGIHHTLQPTIP